MCQVFSDRGRENTRNETRTRGCRKCVKKSFLEPSYFKKPDTIDTNKNYSYFLKNNNKKNKDLKTLRTATQSLFCVIPQVTFLTHLTHLTHGTPQRSTSQKCIALQGTIWG